MLAIYWLLPMLSNSFEHSGLFVHSVEWFYAICIEKLLTYKVHLIHYRNFPKVALLGLPVGVAHGEPMFPSCLAAALASSWHERKFSFHQHGSAKRKESSLWPLWSQFAASCAPKAICFAWGWVWNLGNSGSWRKPLLLLSGAEARCCHSGVAMPLWGWMFANFGDFGTALFWTGRICPDGTIAMRDPLSFSCQLIWLWRFGFVFSEHPYVWEREVFY